MANQQNQSTLRCEETISSRQMLVNVTWAIGSVVGCIGTILLIGWLRGSL